MAGYHKKKITKGHLGEASKIREEFEEFIDACDQDNQIMQICELADIYGAIESYIERFNLDMDDIKVMSDVTKRAFRNGDRQ